MTTETTNLIILGALLAIVLVLLMLIARIGRLHKAITAASKSPKVASLPEKDKARIEESLREKTEAQITTIIKGLQKETDDFIKQLKDALLGQATETLTTQLYQSKQLLAKTIEELDQKLTSAGTEAANQLRTEVGQQKHLLVEQFEQHMASVISSYLVAALGTEVAQSDQAAQAIAQLEAHKEELRKDLLHAA